MSLTVSDVAPSPSATCPNDIDSIAAYESLAEEYDSPAHETTRLLERASAIAFQRSGLKAILGAGSSCVVELGTGTGALTARLLDAQVSGRLVISDPAPSMLRSALLKVDRADQTIAIDPFLGSAVQTLASLEQRPDFLVAGLCDPFISSDLLLIARKLGGQRTQMFVTVPGAAWAAQERSLRLHLPVGQTRFRLANGKAVHSRSRAVGEDELVELFEDSGFKAARHGAVRLPSFGRNPAPEVVWCWAVPTANS